MKLTIVLLSTLALCLAGLAIAPTTSADTLCATGNTACVCAVFWCYDRWTENHCWAAVGLHANSMTGIGCVPNTEIPE